MSHSVSSQTNLAQRLVCLDLVKGLGILEFICWHVFQNFYAYPPNTAALHRMVFSVTGFFVFSSGFLVGCHYYGKLSKGREPFSIFKHLCIRAGKLLIIVLVANLTIFFFKTREFSLENLLIVLKKTASLFYIDRWDVSLQVLMSIAVTLLAGYLLLLLIHRLRYALHIFLLLLTLLTVADLLLDDRIPYLWRYVLHGMFGVIVGMFFFQNVFSGKFSKSFIRISGFVFLGIFLTIEGIVAVKNTAYDFFLLNLGPDLLAVSAYFIGFNNIFYLLYDLRKRSLGWGEKILINLGEQSLFVYLVQITLIDLIVLIFKEYRLHTQWECFVFSVLIVLICAVSSKLMDYAMQYKFIERFYRAVFQ